MKIYNSEYFDPLDITADLLRNNAEFDLKDFFSESTPEQGCYLMIITKNQNIGIAFNGHSSRHINILRYLLRRIFPEGKFCDSKFYTECLKENSKDNIIVYGYKSQGEYDAIITTQSIFKFNEFQRKNCLDVIKKIRQKQAEGMNIEFHSRGFNSTEDISDIEEYEKNLIETSIDTQDIPTIEFNWSQYNFEGCTTEEDFKARAYEYARDLLSKINASKGQNKTHDQEDDRKII